MRAWSVVVTVLLIAAGTLFASSYPEAIMTQVNELRTLAEAKKDMPPSIEGMSLVSTDEAYAMYKSKKAVFLDNRVKSQVDTEKIAGAEWFFCDELLQNPSFADKLDKSKDYVLYCNGKTCWRSPATVLMLKSLGFTKVHWYRGGLPEWKVKAYPTE